MNNKLELFLRWLYDELAYNPDIWEKVKLDYYRRS